MQTLKSYGRIRFYNIGLRCKCSKLNVIMSRLECSTVSSVGKENTLAYLSGASMTKKKSFTTKKKFLKFKMCVWRGEGGLYTQYFILFVTYEWAQ